MIKTIYADVFFLINFIINYLILFTSGYISALYIQRLRLLLAAAVGALYGFCIFFPSLSFIASFPLKLIFSSIMILISFGYRNIIKNSLLFLGISFLFGGVVFVASLWNLNCFYELRHGVYYIHLSLPALLSASFFSYILLKLIFRRGSARSDRKLSTVIVCSGNKKISITALHDTGNSLREPGSNANIVISDYFTFREVLPENIKRIMDNSSPDHFPLLLDKLSEFGKFNLIPYQTVGADFSLMLTYRPETILLNDKPLKGAVIGFSRQRISDNELYSAII